MLPDGLQSLVPILAPGEFDQAESLEATAGFHRTRRENRHEMRPVGIQVLLHEMSSERKGTCPAALPPWPILFIVSSLMEPKEGNPHENRNGNISKFRDAAQEIAFLVEDKVSRSLSQIHRRC